nr:MAG TPA: hypothetical protein [Caudoviricetes sp.]
MHWAPPKRGITRHRFLRRPVLRVLPDPLVHL